MSAPTHALHSGPRARGPRLAVLLVLAVPLGLPPRSAAQGSKVVEHDLGQKAKSYRVLIPDDVKKDERLPMVVYLHPSGKANFEDVQRDYWPIFRKHRFLMLMPRSRGKTMWIAGEQQFVADCIEHVQSLYAIHPGNVLLLGVSGGGQVALLLADRLPANFRAAIVVSTNPVVARGHRAEWFYPNRQALKTCPYFVVNHITQGSALKCWRIVRAKLAPLGASISIRPMLGKAGHYLAPPTQLAPWLAEVMAGKHPKPLPDIQKLAVASLFAKVTAAVPKALKAAPAAPSAKKITKAGVKFDLTVPLPEEHERSAREDRADSTGEPLTQVRFEHAKWPIYIRVEASATAKPMRTVLAAEEAENKSRGMLYQIYRTQQVPCGGRFWQVKIGSMTYPDRRKDTDGKPRGWVSVLFLHASAPIRRDPRQWLAILVMDETGKPDAAELAGLFKLAATGLVVRPGTAPAVPKKPKAPTTKPKTPAPKPPAAKDRT